MKKTILFLLILFCFIHSTIEAVDIFEEFRNNIQQQYLNPFTKDLVGLMNSNPVNDAKSLNFFTATPPSVGLNIRVYSPIKEIDKENFILQNAFQSQDMKYIFLPILQIEKGLPYNIDLIGRVSGYFYKGFVFYGFGLRYNFLSLPPVVSIFNFSIAGFYNFLKVEDVLSANSTSLNLIVSINKIPFISPYLLVGIDNGELETSQALSVGSLKGKVSDGLRYEAGLNLSFLPILYLNFGYSKVYDTNAYSFGLGLKF